jgi:predicted nucleic acid-binding protein
MYLLDTNIWLERLLDQDHSDEVGELLEQIPTDQLLITDFSFHSIGVILNRLGRRAAFLSFVQDVLIDGGVAVVALHPLAMPRLIEVMERYRLDFDDAYQYVTAEEHSAVLVSLDGDFDRTERGRMTPAAAALAGGS